jgi:hypothetical protein
LIIKALIIGLILIIKALIIGLIVGIYDIVSMIHIYYVFLKKNSYNFEH